MIMLVCSIWSLIGVGIIILAIWGVVSNAYEKKINKKEEMKSIKNRLEKIEDKLEIIPDDNDEYYY
ncbi:hypothetical protein I4T76_003749 [Salmonella enterica]|uniref:Uncharacterized protein n=1 Tax=Salmonella enterica subsp. enterica serovar Pensacola TaxID=34042 RepID=A0A602Z1P8_SALET|nr:hypothetical protein [Salmonella enterica]ECT8495466.1 hypothetical protein [Salmonella enterica subsp. enterica serovar Pensacola]EDW1732718.1 hypothetical protein [Salmonella enterica subsp. enterica]EGS7301143.1 hypothetical protein [Salmonella enterica]EKO4094217.1 hypothetical protein [Salmonella enterica]